MAPTFDQRFRAVNDWLVPRGWKAGFPNCHQANYNDGRGTVYGTHLMHANVADWRDVFARDMGNPGSNQYRIRLTTAHDYAVRNGYDHGFPNFHQADYGQGVVYGTFLIKKGFTQWRDVPVGDLGMSGDPTAYPLEEWFRRIADYAARNGFPAGMPNGHYAYYGRWVIGAHFFLAGSIEWRDVPGYELGFEPKPSPWQIVSANSQVLAIHAALMPSGEVLYFGGDEHSQAQHQRNEIDNTRLFNPSTNVSTYVGSPTTDIFCSGHAFLSDGQLLVAGGTETWGGDANDPHGHAQAGHFTGHRAAWLFDYRIRGWRRIADMRPQPGFEATNEGGGRWYPTLITLGDGRVLATSGHPNRTDRRHSNTSPERYFPESNSWGVLTAQAVDSPYYPRMHLLPSGNVFIASPVGDANRFYNPVSGTFAGPNVPLPGDGLYNGWGATSVLLPLLPGDGYRPRVMICGAVQPRRIDLGAAAPSWQNAGTRTGAAAGRARENACAVILPTGQVFVSGGVSDPRNDATAVRAGEIYSPGIDWGSGTYAGAESWTSTEPAQVTRNYHSVALLLPDGRVWTAGSSKNAAQGDPASVGELRLETYRPPYYADPSRPTITASPTGVAYGQSFEVRSPQAARIRRVALVRAGSVTHAFDSDQRYVGLRFGYVGDDRLAVTSPPNGNVAPPGYYMLWILDDAGRPCSRARFVRVAPLPPRAASVVSQSVPLSMFAGQRYTVSITMRNTGALAWSAGGANPYRLGSQNPQDNTTWGLGRVALPSDAAPGAQVAFNFTVTAPSNPGRYNFQWRMVQELVTWFGDYTPNVAVNVVLRQLRAWSEPRPPRLGVPVQVTVRAVDAETQAPVAGTVSVRNPNSTPLSFKTNTPFTFTFRVARVGRPPDVEIVFPTATVTAPGYASAPVDLGWGD